jgi:hypothetical protein
VSLIIQLHKLAGGILVRFDEFLAEFEWLVEGGVSMVMACTILGRKPRSVEKLFYRHGLPDLARALAAEIAWPNVPGVARRDR